MISFEGFTNRKLLSSKTYDCALPIVTATTLLDYSLEQSEVFADYDCRLPAESIQTFGRNKVGDRSCINHQIFGHIRPLLKRSNPTIFGCEVRDGLDGALAGKSMFIGTTEYRFSGGGLSIMSKPSRILMIPGQDKLIIDAIVPTPLQGTSTDATCLNLVPIDDVRLLTVKAVYTGQRIPKYNIYSISVTLSLIYSETVNGYDYTRVKNFSSGSISRATNPTLYDRYYTKYLGRSIDPMDNVASFITTVQSTTSWVKHQDLCYSETIDDRFKGYATAKKLQEVISFRYLIAEQSIPVYNQYWPDLADTAVDNAKFEDVNAIAYVSDLRKFGHELLNVVSLVRDPTDPKRWSSLYLSYRYGSRLTISDTNDLVHGMKKYASLESEIRKWQKPYRVLRSRKTIHVDDSRLYYNRTSYLNYKVYYQPDNNRLLELLRTLYEWDILPTLQNMWDLVPYSFVVDWFVNVEDICNELDRRTYETMLNIIGSCFSSLDIFYLKADLSHYGCTSSDLHGRTYRRHTLPVIHQQELRVLANHLTNINVIDGIALLFQKA